MSVEPALIACGLMVHALRGRLDSAQLLLDALDDHEVRAVALKAVDGLAEAVRSLDAVNIAEHVADGIQQQVYRQEGPQT